MKDLVLLFLLISLSGCQWNEKESLIQKTDTFSKEKKEIKAEHTALQNTSDSKVFNKCDPNCVWRYHHLFADSTYVFAIQSCGEEYIEKEKNTRLYFGIDRGLTDKIIWVENIYVQQNGGGTVTFEDYNNDEIKDLLIYKGTGARGSNEYYYLYLINQRKNQVKKVEGFEEIVNPEYDKKHNVIVSYGFSGSNSYSIYKISEKNVVYQVGESFEDDFDGDAGTLDRKITELLK